MKRYRKGSKRRWWNSANDNGSATLKPRQFLDDVVLKYEGDECLIWPYARNGNGYGHIVVGGKNILISRIACEEENGPPPFNGAQAAHSCGKGKEGCASRKHLRWANQSQNEEDKEAHGTAIFGSRNGSNKLQEHEVIEIYQSKGIRPTSELAAQFGVVVRTVGDIHRGRIWSWLTGANDNRDKVRAEA